MSFFFPQALAGSHASYSPLVHILHDLESASRAPHHQPHRRQCAAQRPFTPRFDVREQADSYQLEGELPGVTQENIDIEFTDPQTLVVRGSSSYSRTTGSAPKAATTTTTTKPAAAVEAAPDAEKDTAAAAAADSTTDDDAVMVDKPTASHQATVEDETSADAPIPATGTTVTVTEVEEKATVAAPAPEQPQSRYWVSERSTGRFSRSFTFAERVDTEAVRASFANGVLSIAVPKAKIERRKIAIQ